MDEDDDDDVCFHEPPSSSRRGFLMRTERRTEGQTYRHEEANSRFSQFLRICLKSRRFAHTVCLRFLHAALKSYLFSKQD